MSDWIDELVDAALEAGPQKPSWLGTCPNANCYENWHGRPAGKCPGSHRTPTKEELDAIQSQGCLHWDAL